MLARVRDLFQEMGQGPRASSIEQDYIRKIDLESGESKSQISLNTEDNTFFLNAILGSYPPKIEEGQFLRASNRRLLTASRVAYEYLKNHIGGFGKDLQAAQLTRWVRFIKERTHVIAVSVLDEKIYKNSEYAITNQLEKYGNNFGLTEVKDRQDQLSALAVKTWSLTFPN